VSDSRNVHVESVALDCDHKTLPPPREVMQKKLASRWKISKPIRLFLPCRRHVAGGPNLNLTSQLTWDLGIHSDEHKDNLGLKAETYGTVRGNWTKVSEGCTLRAEKTAIPT
jgi:hypothetical protein